MTTNFSGSPYPSVSAAIYTFPPRGRFAVAGQREAFKPAAVDALPPGAKIVSGSAWYHEEAIQETDQRRSN
jgi:hypothetical protein